MQNFGEMILLGRSKDFALDNSSSVFFSDLQVYKTITI